MATSRRFCSVSPLFLEKMDCSVCFETIDGAAGADAGKKRKSAASLAGLQCQSCGTATCVKCQEQYAIPSCVSCKAAFTLSFLVKAMGKVAGTKLYRPFHEKVLEEKEVALLPGTQVYLDWERAYEEAHAQIRRGAKIKYPNKPMSAIVTSVHSFYPCPSNECRGFVEKGTCGVCKADVCETCRSIKGKSSQTAHTCKPDDVASVASILENTKPCPKCGVAIFRTEGCDHMHCTHCRTHFNWKTGNVMSKSTNHHYENTSSFAANVAMRGSSSAGVGEAVKGDGQCFYETEEEVQFNAVVEVSVPGNVRDSPWFGVLYKDLPAARYMARNLYGSAKLATDMAQKFLKLRVKHLKGELSKKDWCQKMYVANQQYMKSTAIADVLHTALMVYNDMQRMWRASKFAYEGTPEMHLALKQVAEATNEALDHIKEEYGGTVPTVCSVIGKPLFAM